jgi:predicted nucleic acid-binding Zn ribbon protein
VSRLAPRPIAEALAELTRRIAPASTLGRIQELWPRVAGSAIAAHATPVAERDGVLTVSCEASVWAQELDLMGDDLVAALNAAMEAPAVRELRCRTG